jgi:acylphosphatase
MKRLTAYVSGKIQKVGYRARVVDMAKLLGLKGTVQNLEDGRVKVIAEGEENDLERFLKAIDIRNTVIRVSSVTTEYSQPVGDFDNFYKQVDPGETDSRLDQGVVVLNKILVAVEEMNKNLGSKIDNVSADIKDMNRSLGNKMDDVSADIKDMNKNLGGKIDDVRADIVGEVRELRRQGVGRRLAG